LGGGAGWRGGLRQSPYLHLKGDPKTFLLNFEETPIVGEKVLFFWKNLELFVAKNL